MKHFGIDEWVDFARGLTSNEDQVAMREHLASGCGPCSDVAKFCDRLSQVCLGMAPYEVPDSVVRGARAIFPKRPPERHRRSIRLPIELIFDSFLVPAPAGLRATWQVGWQGLYRAGDCSVDLRIEPELRSSRATVIGQISNHVSPSVEMGDILVCLKSGKVVLAETRSNRFGEFQLEYEQQSRLHLQIYLENGAKTIQLPLKAVAAEKPAGTERLHLGTLSGKRRTNEGQV
jgi:hypothetical protein